MRLVSTSRGLLGFLALMPAVEFLLALAAAIEITSIGFSAANPSLVCHRHGRRADRIDLVREDTDCLLDVFSASPNVICRTIARSIR